MRLSVFTLSAYYTMGSFPTKSKTSADMPKVTDFCPQGSRGCASAHKNRGSPRRGASSEFYLIKCVHACSSVSGSPNFSLPRAILFIRKVMFRASVRMVCFPSSSMSASPFSRPWIEFQYWLDAIGILDMVKYLFSSSNVAEHPPRLAQTTLAPIFMVLSKGVL